MENISWILMILVILLLIVIVLWHLFSDAPTKSFDKKTRTRK